jgi:cell division septal protein FtsQ
MPRGAKPPWAEDGSAPEPRTKARAKERKRPSFSFVRYGLRLLLGGLVLVGGLYGCYRAEKFVINDPRFLLPTPEYGLESPGLTVDGVHYTSRLEVLRVFANDFGRSLYLVPLERRREQLLAIGWIRQASIARLWPNRLLVKVTERQPVAFIQTAPNPRQFSRFALIDPDGVILETPPRANFKLPVVTGVRVSEAQAARREKVHRLMRLMSALGGLGNRVSEVDVADGDNLKVTTAADNHAVVLLLGSHNFEQRFENFVNHYAEIQQRLPGATILDMRLEDRITVVK